MGKKAWIVFIVICVVIVAVALVLMLLLVPQSKASKVQGGSYEMLAKQEYTYSGKATTDKLTQQYNITEDEVSKGIKTNKYEEGNINPFTPNSDVTIYNEPTKEADNKTQSGSTTLTPNSK